MLKKLWAKFKKEREGDRKADRDTGRQKESEREREREREDVSCLRNFPKIAGFGLSLFY